MPITVETLWNDIRCHLNGRCSKTPRVSVLEPASGDFGSLLMIKRKTIVLQCHRSVGNSAFDKQKTTWSYRKKSFSERYMTRNFESPSSTRITPVKNWKTQKLFIYIYIFVCNNESIISVSNYEFWPSNILGKRAMQLVRDHLTRRQERKKSRTSKQICYGKK